MNLYRSMKFTLLHLFFSLFSSVLFGQTKLLVLDHSCKDKLSNTSSLSVIDNRLDNQILGYVETGISDKVTAIKFQGSLADTVSLFFKNIKSYPELVMMLNEFHIWEFRDRDEKFGRFKISLRFFKPVENKKYVEVMAYDSIHSVYGKIDITNRLMKSVSKTLCRIASDIDESKKSNHPSHETPYTKAELKVIDSLEKSLIPIYQIDKPQAGIYAKYSDFKTNTPTKKTELIIDEYNPENVKAYYIDKKGKKKYITSKDIYAISDGARVFKSLSMGFFEMVKEKEDFYFVRPTTTGQSVGYMYSPIGAGIVGGVVGSLINSYSNHRKGQLLLYKVNHRFGGGIPISKVYR